MSVRLSASEVGGEVGSEVGSEVAKCVLSTSVVSCGVLWMLIKTLVLFLFSAKLYSQEDVYKLFYTMH